MIRLIDLVEQESIYGKKVIIPNEYVYHVSNPVFRKSIMKYGLLPKFGEQRYDEENPEHKEAIYVTNSDEKGDWFDSDFDDDVWKIDTKNLNNKFYLDNLMLNKKENQHLVTFNKIPKENISLIYKGTGKSK